MRLELLEPETWKTKPTDRFVLKWIKCRLSARITPRLVGAPWLQPWMLTLGNTGLAALAGIVFALGLGWLAGLLAALSQVLDGVDGQFARLTGRTSRAGAFMDSVMDRYADGALVIGLVLYLARMPEVIPRWVVLFLGALALIGSNLVSYSTARAENLNLPMGKPTLCSKGTRTTVTALCGMGSLVWPLLPAVALGYLVIHPNALVATRLIRAYRLSAAEPAVLEGDTEPREDRL